MAPRSVAPLRNALAPASRAGASRAPGLFSARDGQAKSNGDSQTPANSARSFSSSSSALSAAASTSSAVATPRPAIPADVQTHRIKEAAALSSPEDQQSSINLDSASLSLLYNLTTPPPLSSLSAFAARLSSGSASLSLEAHLPLLEQCLVHPSFWEATAALPPSALSSNTRQFTHALDAEQLHNGPLAALGNALLGSLTAELVLKAFPNLPTRVAKAGLTMYVGPKALAEVARASWGVGPSRLDLKTVGREDEQRLSRRDKAYGHLVGGVGPARKEKGGEKDGAAGAGLVRWNRRSTTPTKDAVLYEDALASVARALVGAIYTVHGFSTTRSFIHAHFLSRLITPATASHPPAAGDLLPLLKFTNPTRVLSLTLLSQGQEPLVHRLLKESGRLSAHPTFVCGAFSGEQKVGEGFGSSIKMAQWRASEDALRRKYLATGTDGGAKGALPSESWVNEQAQFAGLQLGETEVTFASR